MSQTPTGHLRANVGRRKTRKLVLQVLYEVDTSHHNVADVCDRLLSRSSLPPYESGYARKLIDGIIGKLSDIDNLIRQHAKAWPVEDLPPVDRNILRIAIYEISFSQDTPSKVSINEAVELAKLFGADNSPKFVNGVLGAVLDTLETQKSQPSS